MKVITEDKQVVGALETTGNYYQLLDLNPIVPRDHSWLVKENTFQFYVIVEGFGQYILVSRNSFAIIPYLEPEVKSVKFLVLDDDKEEELPGSYDVEELRR